MVKPIRIITLTSAIGIALVSGGLQFSTDAQAASRNVSSPVALAQANGSEIYIIAFAEDGLLHYQGGNSGMQATSPDGQKQRKLDVHSAAAQTYRHYLETQRNAHLAAIHGVIGRDLAVTHTYTVIRSGIAASLSAAEAASIASIPGVKSVRAAGVQQQTTYRGPTFIGADTIWSGANTPGNVATKGQGIVFGDLDGGTSSTNPLFANDATCGFRDSKPKLIAVDCSATDVNGFCAGPDPEANPGFGHGVHTSSTVAGNTIDNTASPAPLLPDGGDHVGRCARRRFISTRSVRPIVAPVKTSRPASKTQSPIKSTC